MSGWRRATIRRWRRDSEGNMGRRAALRRDPAWRAKKRKAREQRKSL